MSGTGRVLPLCVLLCVIQIPSADAQNADPDALVKRGAALLRQGRTSLAKQQLESVLALHPEVSEGWNLLGVARDLLGDYTGAVEAFESAIRLKPGNPRTHFNLGRCHQSHGEYLAATTALLESLRLDPSQPRVHAELAAAYAGLGKFQEAANFAERAVELSPEDSDARIRWGEILSNLGLFQKALAQFQQVARAEPAHSLAALRSGQTLKLLGKWPEAIEALKRVQAPDCEPLALVALGGIYIDQGNLSDAISTLLRAADLDPGRPEAWYELARCKIRQHEWSAAGELLHRALTFNPELLAAQYQLGRIYLELGDTVQADTHFQSFRLLEARERDRRKSTKRMY